MDLAFLPEKTSDCTVNQAGFLLNMYLYKMRADTTYYYTRRFRSTFDVTVHKVAKYATEVPTLRQACSIIIVSALIFIYTINL